MFLGFLHTSVAGTPTGVLWVGWEQHRTNAALPGTRLAGTAQMWASALPASPVTPLTRGKARGGEEWDSWSQQRGPLGLVCCRATVSQAGQTGSGPWPSCVKKTTPPKLASSGSNSDIWERCPRAGWQSFTLHCPSHQILHKFSCWSSKSQVLSPHPLMQSPPLTAGNPQYWHG